MDTIYDYAEEIAKLQSEKRWLEGKISYFENNYIPKPTQFNCKVIRENNEKTFSSKLTKEINNGAEVISSGYEPFQSCEGGWWAILKTYIEEEINNVS